MTERIEHKSLADAVLAVMDEVQYIQRQYSEVLGFPVVSEQSVLQAIRGSLIKHGLTLWSRKMNLEVCDKYNTRDERVMHRAVISATFCLEHASTGQRKYIEVLGEGDDPGGRSVPKAMTVANKYVLLKSFLLETGDDPDAVVSERGEDNYERFRRASTAIHQAAGDETRLSKYVAIIDAPDSGFSQEQVEKLHKLVAENRRK